MIKKGFTLAEVLITLAIIGVVASLTIPTLISSYKKITVETKLKYAYSVINQAIKMSEAEYGNVANWKDWLNAANGDEKLELFNKYIGSHLSVLKTERTSTSATSIYLKNGTILRLEGNDITLLMDKKAIDNPKPGINLFVFRFNPITNNELNKYHYGKGFEPYAYTWGGSKSELFNARYGTNYGCGEPDSAFCAKLIQLNGWKIPDDYPYKF